MTPEEYIELYEKFIAGECTREEEEALNSYQDNFYMQEMDAESKLFGDEKVIRANIYRKVVHSVSDKKIKIIKRSWLWAAAAVLFFSLGVGSLLLKDRRTLLTADNNKKGNNAKPIKPGSNTAILTLANGSTIVLDDAKNGVMATSGNTSIKKLGDGVIAYEGGNAQGKVDQAALNVITIPRGGQYTIILPDGTKVWLNSASALTYPVAFKGAERSVALKGEAYFEVAKNKHLPFVVHTSGVDVKVLGTHFNVTAYQDEEEIKTTLLEGSVKLMRDGASALLVPGQQGVAGPAMQQIITKEVNVNQVVAWKSGYFIFRDTDIRDIMKQIGRWYDVDIEFRGNISKKIFGGTYAKSKEITELLNGLELTGLVHFKIEGRRIIVMG